MIDIHAHILPGIDDGPGTMEESLLTAAAFVAAGYLTVVATPHVIKGLYENTREKILAGVQSLQEQLESAGISLTILPGAEYHLTTNLLQMFEAGELVTLGDSGKYLLVELPVQEVPSYTSQVLFELLLAGITPIIAHPERNNHLARNPGTLAEMVQKGVLSQVTAGCLTGLFGPTSKRVAHSFLKEGLAHFVATDAHGPGYRLQAGPIAVRVLGERSGVVMADYPAVVVQGAAFEFAADREAKPLRKGFLSGLFDRNKD